MPRRLRRSRFVSRPRTRTYQKKPAFSWGNIVNSAIGGLVILLISWALNRQTASSDKLNHLNEQLPVIADKVNDVKSDVKEVKSELKVTQAQMVTRTELQNKNDRLTDAIKSVSDKQDRFQDQLLRKK